jgi:hypothetical protein
MKMLAKLIGCLMVVSLGHSCSMVKPLSYSAVIANEGQEWMSVLPFNLADAPHSTVHVGEVHPGGRAGMSSFYYRPDQEVTITWRLMATGAERRARATIELPKEFTKERGSAIVFNVKPEDGTVTVTYEILDPKTERMSVIRQGDGAGP